MASGGLFVSNGRFVTGGEGIDRKLAALPAAMADEVRQALVAGGQLLVSQAKSIAPVSTEFDRTPGALRDSIRVENGRHALSITVVADARAVTGRWAGRPYAAFVEYGHVSEGRHVPAHPYAWPAYRVTKRRIKSGITRAMRRAIARITA